MTVAKVTEPSSLMVIFYYYYSYFTVLTSWLIGPILFYTILTQSRKLGNYKWFILNHSFWCLAFVTIYGLMKPLLLPPVGCGYLLGPLRYISDFHTTLVLTIVGCVILGNCVISLCATWASRYLLIFPDTIFKWLNLKISCVIMILVNLACYGLIGYALYPVLQLKHETIVEWSDAEDSGLKIFYENEPTFFMVPHENHQNVDILVLLFLAGVHCLGFFVLIFFVRQLYKRSNKFFTSKLHRSLIFSIMAQMILTSLFLFLPIMLFFVCILFQFSNVTTFATFFSCVITSHSILEFFATFYFVTPYRKFILHLFRFQKSNFRPPNMMTTLVSVF